MRHTKAKWKKQSLSQSALWRKKTGAVVTPVFSIWKCRLRAEENNRNKGPLVSRTTTSPC